MNEYSLAKVQEDNITFGFSGNELYETMRIMNGTYLLEGKNHSPSTFKNEPTIWGGYFRLRKFK